MLEQLVFAVFLSLIAGLSTSIGGILAFVFKKPGPKVLSFVMGFSAGVMIFVSFTELLQEGIEIYGIFISSLFFLAGMGLMLIIDLTITHKYHFDEKLFSEECSINDRIEKTTLFVFLGIFIHNFPEGIATVVGTLENVEIGIILAVAIALHNIPEGIAVAIPICAAGKSRKKGLFWAFLSGMSEPLGAIVFGIIFLPFISTLVLASLLSFVGGIMVYVSVDELLPVSHCFGNESSSIIGIVAGMFIMALSLSLL
jgi:ZIP family zinc transporter